MNDYNTNSFAFPKMLDVTRNRVATYEGNRSIVNRTKLLILTNPTELYNSPTFGVGLKRYLWQYNTSNTKAIIHDRIKEQLREHEPYVDADMTSFSDGLVFTGDATAEFDPADYNRLKMTVGLSTIYKDELNVAIDLEKEQIKMFGLQEG